MDCPLPNNSFAESAIATPTTPLASLANTNLNSGIALDTSSIDQSLSKLMSAAAASSSAPLQFDTSSDALTHFAPFSPFVPMKFTLPAGTSSMPQSQTSFTPLFPNKNLQNVNIALNVPQQLNCGAVATPGLSPIPTPQQMQSMTRSPATDQNNPAPARANDKSVASKFLTMFYNQMHCNILELKRFYSFNAHIERQYAFMETGNGSGAGESFVDVSKYYNDPIQQKLAILAPIQDIVVKNVCSQKCFKNAILIQVSGTMRITLRADTHAFSQTFIIYRADVGYWLIQNDILRVDAPVSTPSPRPVLKQKLSSGSSSKSAVSPSGTPAKSQSQTSSNSYSSVAASLKDSKSNAACKSNSVSSSETASRNSSQQQHIHRNLANNFYQNSSYQKYRNEYAIFIRGIRNDITHRFLGTELMAALNKKAASESKAVDVMLSYIDINYTKHFAFVYFGNEESLNLALSLKQLLLNSSVCSIEQKHSYNGQRRLHSKPSSYGYEGH